MNTVPVSDHEKKILRELAKCYEEIASLPTQEERKKRMTQTNDLQCVRPIVLIDEVPWHEMNVDNQLTLLCENNFARSMEWFFRKTLYQWKYFPCDLYVERAYTVHKTIHSTGNGMEVAEKTISTDSANNIVSHEFNDQLQTEDDLEKLKIPIITADEARDRENMALAEEILAGILPVRLRGTGIYYAPWDEIPRLHGVTESLYDMADRAEFIHAIIQKFTEIGLSTMQQYEDLGLLEPYPLLLHCTPAQTGDLPSKDYTGGPAKLKDVWIRSMAQMFSTISPDMHEEFDLQYSKRLFEKCGLVYYGCCEPLDNKIEMLRQIPNLRKLGVSPWSNIESSAEQMGRDYVFARKPNPAHVAIRTDPEVIRKEITETLEACRKYNCPCEFVLKDISTVSYRPENLTIWDRTVRETIDAFYA